MSNLKDTNPKDAVGIKKVPASCTPQAVIAEASLGMLEGALKYGRHNYRVVGVRASVYYDACRRHLDAWWEGQDLDPKSGVGLHHLAKAMASLIVLRDAMMNGCWVDDRPPPMTDPDWVESMNKIAEALIEMYPAPKPAYTAKVVSRRVVAQVPAYVPGDEVDSVKLAY